MNQGSPANDIQHDSGSSTNNVHTYERDPVYYYPDGNIVFLVEGILFKLHASLILPVGSISSTANSGQQYPLGVENLPERLTDSSDTKPIILSDVTTNQFRNYLVVLLGRPYTAEFRAIFTDAGTKTKHNYKLIVPFLDIARVSHRFGMEELKDWALSQLELAFHSIYDLAELSWDKDTLLQINKYARSCGRPKFCSQVTNFTQYFISIWTVPENRPTGQECASSNLDTCVQLFKDPNLLNDDPALFGCLFASILSLGHRSPAWTSGVTRNQRTALCVAQVELINLDEELDSVAWLVGVRGHPLPLQFVAWTCRRCSGEFEIAWNDSFVRCEGLGSNFPLRDIIGLARLPQSRRSFSCRCNSEFPSCWTAPLDCSATGLLPNPWSGVYSSDPRCLYLNLPGDTRPRDRVRCAEPEWPLGYIDYYIQLVYRELAKRYKDIISKN